MTNIRPVPNSNPTDLYFCCRGERCPVKERCKRYFDYLSASWPKNIFEKSPFKIELHDEEPHTMWQGSCEEYRPLQGELGELLLDKHH